METGQSGKFLLRDFLGSDLRVHCTMYIVHSCIPVWEARGDSAQVSSPELKSGF